MGGGWVYVSRALGHCLYFLSTLILFETMLSFMILMNLWILKIKVKWTRFEYEKMVYKDQLCFPSFSVKALKKSEITSPVPFMIT